MEQGKWISLRNFKTACPQHEGFSYFGHCLVPDSPILRSVTKTARFLTDVCIIWLGQWWPGSVLVDLNSCPAKLYDGNICRCWNFTSHNLQALPFPRFFLKNLLQ